MDPTNPAVVSRAETIYAEMEDVFAPRHTVRKVELASFKHLDHAFYEDTTRAMEREGFRHLVDIENTTLTRIYPHNKTMIRVFAHRDGAMSAACYNIRFTGWMRFVAWIFRLPRNIRVVEFETEFNEGTFLSTTTAVDNHLDPEPGVIQSKFDPETPVADLAREHFNAVIRYRAEHEGVMPVPMRTYDDVLASQDRQQELKSAYRREIGYLTEPELVRMAGPKQEAMGRALFSALQLIHQSRNT